MTPARFGIGLGKTVMRADTLQPSARSLRLNDDELVMQAVLGQIAHPVGRATPYRIGYDGTPRVLPGTGGIVINRRIGDRCVGLAGDHIEPGVALHNNGREIIGPRNGPNMALLTNACVGNLARVTSGPCAGAHGLVTGKHGGVNHVIVDFATATLQRLNIGDNIQVYSFGLGLRLLDFPEITVANCAPGLLRRLARRTRDNALEARISHVVPAALIGSGLGKNTVWRGDFDIQLADPEMRKRHGLETLRFGDFVAVTNGDGRFGPSWRHGRITVGVVVHGDSTVSGHGPGVTALLTGPAPLLRPTLDANANIAALYHRRALSPPRRYLPLAARSTGTRKLQSPNLRGLRFIQ
jgi:hypothetical protein